MKTSGDVRMLIGLFVVLLVGACFVAAPEHTTESKAPTSYNADPAGNKALFTLLGRLGYRVARLFGPYDEIPKNARVLIVIQPGKRGSEGREISENESLALIRWVRGGGTVFFFSDGLTGVPAMFNSTRGMNWARIHSFDSSTGLTNKGARNSDNVMPVVEAVAGSASKGGLILFDEYHHGIGDAEAQGSVMSGQVKVALWVLLAAGLVLGYSRARRFGAVRSLPESEIVRPGFEFVKSVGMLYRRAQATDLAAEILCGSFRRGLCLKLALPADASGDVVLRRMKGDIEPEVCERVGVLLAGCRRFEAGEKPSESELLDIALEVSKLEKELGIGAVDG